MGTTDAPAPGTMDPEQTPAPAVPVGTLPDTTEPVATAPEPTLEEKLAAEAAAQSPGEPQVVPEQRPQAFTGSERISDASKRIDVSPAPTQEGIDVANSDEAKEASMKTSRRPNLIAGQRVTILPPNPEAGRMAYVLSVEFVDGLQGMLAASGQPEARFAEVANYILRTRDGRSDILEVKPDEVKPLDDIEGWGRGQI